MSHSITVELSDETYAALEEEAKAESRSPNKLAANALEERFGETKKADEPSESERQAARERFRRHFGAVSLGHPTGADNESIDADLAREYGRGLDPQ